MSTPQRHGRVHAKAARRVGRRGDDATLGTAAAHDDRLALEAGVGKLLDRYEERIHVNVKNGLVRHGVFQRRGPLPCRPDSSQTRLDVQAARRMWTLLFYLTLTYSLPLT